MISSLRKGLPGLFDGQTDIGSILLRGSCIYDLQQ
jgi:hypothetical protein